MNSSQWNRHQILAASMQRSQPYRSDCAPAPLTYARLVLMCIRRLDENFNSTGNENSRYCFEHSFGMEHAQDSFRRSKRVLWEGGYAPFRLPRIYSEQMEQNILSKTVSSMYHSWTSSCWTDRSIDWCMNTERTQTENMWQWDISQITSRFFYEENQDENWIKTNMQIDLRTKTFCTMRQNDDYQRSNTEGHRINERRTDNNRIEKKLNNQYNNKRKEINMKMQASEGP